MQIDDFGILRRMERGGERLCDVARELIVID